MGADSIDARRVAMSSFVETEMNGEHVVTTIPVEDRDLTEEEERQLSGPAW